MKTLHIRKGMTYSTENGYQEIIHRLDSTMTLVVNLNSSGHYTGASILTDTDILRKAHQATGESYDTVCFDD